MKIIITKIDGGFKIENNEIKDNIKIDGISFAETSKDVLNRISKILELAEAKNNE